MRSLVTKVLLISMAVAPGELVAHSAEDGARLASRHCASCHEAGGANDPPSFIQIAADPWWTSW